MEPQSERASFGIDAFTLKVIAIVAMTIDHVFIVFDAYLPLAVRAALAAPGGITFIVMAFLVCEGCRHTHNIRRYALRMFVFALLSWIPYWLATRRTFAVGALNIPMLDVMFTLALGIVMIAAIKRASSQSAQLAVAVAFNLAAYAADDIGVACDWLFPGITMIAVMWFVTDRVTGPAAAAAVPIVKDGIPMALLIDMDSATFLPSSLYYLVGTTVGAVLTMRYNGQRGHDMRWFFYFYYPVHLMALALLRLALFGA